MQRYFKDTDLDIFELSQDDSYHITKVMRNNIGDLVEVVIDKKLYICEIIDMNSLVTVKRKEEIEKAIEIGLEILE